MTDRPETRTMTAVGIGHHGSDFESIYYDPTPGYFDEDENEFYPESNLKEEWEEYYYESKEEALSKINAVCVS